MAIQKVGVVGCGLMGSGIAQTCAQSGYDTLVLEVNQSLLDKGLARIHDAWTTMASKGKLTQPLNLLAGLPIDRKPLPQNT